MDDLLGNLYDSVIAGDRERVGTLTEQALARGFMPSDVLRKALIPAMAEVGRRMEKQEFFVPEVLVAARAMQQGLDILEPLLADSGVAPTGRVVIGTVKGDLHDIGKNLVGMMLTGAGFEVVDLGIDVLSSNFVDAVVEKEPHILGMSALLTTTMPAMKTTIHALQEAGLREQVLVLIGGAPVTQAYADQIGADGYAPNAASAVEVAKELLGV